MVPSMSLIDRLRPDRSDTAAPAAREPVGWLSAGLAGAWAAGVSLLGLVLLVLVAWAASAQTDATWGEGVRVASQGWLLVHHVELRLPGGGSLSLAPLALSAVPALSCWFAGRRVALGHPDDDLVPDVRSGRPPRVRALVVPVAALSVGYALVTTATAMLASGGGVRPVLWQAVAAGFVLPAVVGGAGALRTGRAAPARAAADLLRLPARLRRCVRPAAMAAFAQVALGSLALVGALVTHHEEVLTLHRSLDPGAVGGAVLTVAQIGVLPNLALYAVAWLAGPGFAVGVGTAVTPAGSTLGLLPAVPVLGAMPAPGPLPALLGAVVLLPVVVGAMAGWFVAARQHAATSPVLDVVTDALTAAALAAGGLTLALALSGGSGGPGLLDAVGPSAWKVGLVLAAELAAGAAAAAWITHRRRRR
jgi:hypothetical protein